MRRGFVVVCTGNSRWKGASQRGICPGLGRDSEGNQTQVGNEPWRALALAFPCIGQIGAKKGLLAASLNAGSRFREQK